MKDTLRDQFFSAMICSRKWEAFFSGECEMQLNEMMILHKIAGACGGCAGINLNVPDVQEKLRISKPAVSYILNTLEKKNYITRQIDARDRRKISICATPDGMAAAQQSREKIDRLWEAILTQFGEENLRQLTELLAALNALCDNSPGCPERE
ncbi:MAG: MarR family transcriptional regulator [Eubacteriales bacterium]|nr:MarR family transcriptional regulator [Eubacteriales bacterium]